MGGDEGKTELETIYRENNILETIKKMKTAMGWPCMEKSKLVIMGSVGTGNRTR